VELAKRQSGDLEKAGANVREVKQTGSCAGKRNLANYSGSLVAHEPAHTANVTFFGEVSIIEG
jgi:hypothetical protein